MNEASMNFDMENVKPFLSRLEANLKLGLPVEDLVATCGRGERAHPRSVVSPAPGSASSARGGSDRASLRMRP